LAILALSPAFGFGAWMVLLHVLALYVSVRLVFARLSQTAPPVRCSNAFHLWWTGGALSGALFQTLIVPLMSAEGPYEFPLFLAFASALRPAWLDRGVVDRLVERVLPRRAPRLSSRASRRASFF